MRGGARISKPLLEVVILVPGVALGSDAGPSRDGLGAEKAQLAETSAMQKGGPPAQWPTARPVVLVWPRNLASPCRNSLRGRSLADLLHDEDVALGVA